MSPPIRVNGKEGMGIWIYLAAAKLSQKKNF
jgi:hypothetical protein